MRTTTELVKICVRHLWRTGATEEEIRKVFSLSENGLENILKGEYQEWYY